MNNYQSKHYRWQTLLALVISLCANLHAADSPVWVLGTDFCAYARQNVSSSKPQGAGWQRVNNKRLHDVAMGPDGTVWGLDKDQPVGGGHMVIYYNRADNSWHNVAGGLVQVAVGPRGLFWGVNDGGALYHRTGITSSNPKGSGWKHVRNETRYVTIGSDGTMYIITTQNTIHKTQQIDSTNMSWQDIKPPAGKTPVKLAAGPSGQLWLLDQDDNIHAYTSGSWQQVPGQLKNLGFTADGKMWGANRGTNIYISASANPSNPAWIGTDGLAHDVACGGLATSATQVTTSVSSQQQTAVATATPTQDSGTLIYPQGERTPIIEGFNLDPSRNNNTLVFSLKPTQEFAGIMIHFDGFERTGLHISRTEGGSYMMTQDQWQRSHFTYAPRNISVPINQNSWNTFWIKIENNRTIKFGTGSSLESNQLFSLNGYGIIRDGKVTFFRGTTRSGPSYPRLEVKDIVINGVAKKVVTDANGKQKLVDR